MENSHPKCPVCYRRHDTRWTDPFDHLAPEYVALKANLRISKNDGRLHFCYFDPKLRNPNYELKIAALRRLAEHATTPPAEARAARAAIKRLSRLK